MSEKVEQRLEKFAPTFEQLISIGIFTPQEKNEIVKKRRSYEYALQSKAATLDTYLNYIKYETAVMALTEERKLKKGIDTNERLLSDVDWPKHIHSIFRNAIRHFGQSDLKIWNLYFDFCLSNNAYNDLSSAFSQCLKLHRQHPELWIRAATWEMNDHGNPEYAKQLMQEAINELPNVPELYVTLAETIFFITHQIKGRREIHGIEDESDSTRAPLVVYENALSKCKTPLINKRIEVYQLFKELFKKNEQPTDILTEKAIETGDDELLNYIAIEESSTVEKADQKFQEFLGKFPTSQSLKIKYAIFLGKVKKDSKKLVDILDEIDYFTDQEAETFIELLLNNGEVEEAEDFIRDDFHTPKITKLNLRLISMKEKNDNEFIRKANHFLLNHNTFELNSYFLILCQQRQPPIPPEKFLDLVIEKSSLLPSNDVAKIFEFSFFKYGKEYACKMMDKLMQVINPTIKFIDTAIKIEESQKDDNGRPNIAKIRALHELNVTKWGSDNTDVWLNYCDFEYKQKNIQRLESVRRKAERSLSDASEFTRQYQERFCKNRKNH